MYWQEAFPHGICREETDYIINIDKAMFMLETLDPKRGKVTLQRGGDVHGRYKKRGGRD